MKSITPPIKYKINAVSFYQSQLSSSRWCNACWTIVLMNRNQRNKILVKFSARAMFRFMLRAYQPLKLLRDASIGSRALYFYSCEKANRAPASFPGSLFSDSLSRWNRDPVCGWSRDHLSIQNRRVGEYSSTFGREDYNIPPCCPTLPTDFPTTQILGGHLTSRKQPQPGSLFQRVREAEKRDPGNEVDRSLGKLT